MAQESQLDISILLKDMHVKREHAAALLEDKDRQMVLLQKLTDIARKAEEAPVPVNEAEPSERVVDISTETHTHDKPQELTKLEPQDEFLSDAVFIADVIKPKVKIEAQVIGNVISGFWWLIHGNGKLSATAWICVSLASSAEHSYIARSSLLESSQCGAFRWKQLSSGCYVVRVFSDPSTLASVTEPLLVGPQVLHFEARENGDTLEFSYEFDKPPNDNIWIGRYDSPTKVNADYKCYVNGGTSSATMARPRRPGCYTFRLFVGRSNNSEQASCSITIQDNDFISAEVTSEVVRAKWSMRTLKASRQDWVGLLKAEENNNRKYAAFVYTNGTSAGVVDVPYSKDLTGSYKVCLFPHALGKYIVHKESQSFVVNGEYSCL